jgi:transcriptional regulator GlxA family with amidase domain
MSQLEEIKNKQEQILNAPEFGNKQFLKNIEEYIGKGKKDFEQNLKNVKTCLNLNIELMELTNKASFIERELQRAFREEQKVNFKQKSLGLKKEILSKLILDFLFKN